MRPTDEAIYYQGPEGGACPALRCGVLSLRGPALQAVAEAGVWGAEHVLEQVDRVRLTLLDNRKPVDVHFDENHRHYLYTSLR